MLRFRLRANPTKKLVVRLENGERTKNGKRVELLREEEQLSWLQRKASSSGFVICSVRTNTDVPNVRVIPERKLTGTRPATGKLTFGGILFEGILRVADAEVLRRALQDGLGSGKAYGFGLLSVAPLSTES